MRKTLLNTRRALLRSALALGLVAGLGMSLVPQRASAASELLNVSYDPTREFYKEFNKAFAADYKAKTGEDVSIKNSHGGSGAQARAVIDGLNADVVTLALAADIDNIAAKTGKVPADWQKLLPNNSTPYTSTIVFVVRKGNPKNIHDWADLIKPDVQVIASNPKTGGGARWSYLAAWSYAAKTYKGDEAKIKDFVGHLYAHVPVLDAAARGSTTTFAQRGIGDVLIGWENEGFLTLDEFGKDNFEIVVPSISIKAEPPVALVPGNSDKDGTTAAAKAYLDFLYSDIGQKLALKHHFRPAFPEKVDQAELAKFPKLELTTIDGDFGGWKAAQAKHFADGGVFDQIYHPGK